MNIRLACSVKLSSSSELALAYAHNKQLEQSLRRYSGGVIWHHRTTTSELPFT